MRRFTGFLGLLLLAAALGAAVTNIGCAARASGEIKKAQTTTPINPAAIQAAQDQHQDMAHSRAGH